MRLHLKVSGKKKKCLIFSFRIHNLPNIIHLNKKYDTEYRKLKAPKSIKVLMKSKIKAFNFISKHGIFFQ